MIYLDAAATTLEKPPQVRQAMAQAAAELSTPGRGSHPAARRAEETAFRCRAEAAALFGVPSPENVVFILLGRTKDAVLPTIVSRCQVVPFRHIPTTEASGIISQNTGVSAEQARIAVEACNGSVTKAIGFCKSPEKTGFRRRILEILTLLPLSDERDVLEYAAELVKSAKAWVDVVQSEQAEAINESEEFLSKAALKQIEARNKRVLTKASLESLAQVTSIIRSWLRDVLMIKSQAVEQIVNIDVMNDLEQAAARTTPAGLVRAIDATYRCDKAIAYNVSTETCLDTLLFTIREVFYGSGGSH